MALQMLLMVFCMAFISYGDNMKYNELTKEEEAVILHKATERPFSGKLLHNKQPGTYVCRKCSAPLYRSQDKFESGCGWPSFDDELPGAVKRVTDADGRRTEIVCAKCGAHLGHVFEGENLTPKNVRHCVNSISMAFVPTKQSPKTARAIFAGGCFWGVEYYFKNAKGVTSTTVGYIGGAMENPDYEAVSSHKTGHAEALEVQFDPSKTSYEELARLFFEIHDPTQVNRQGPDAGNQYRSEIFYLDNEQKAVAEKLIGILTSKGLSVATKVTKAGTFWKAEDYHQDYYGKTNGSPYCHTRVKRF